MSANVIALCYLISGVLFIQALRGLSHPESSRRGNLLGIDRLNDEQRKAGVVAASGGNHALALSWAAGQQNVPATLHVFESGKHGLGLAKNVPAVSSWPGGGRQPRSLQRQNVLAGLWIGIRVQGFQRRSGEAGIAHPS